MNAHKEFIKSTCDFLESQTDNDDHPVYFLIETIARYLGIAFALFGLLFLISDKRLRTHPGGLVALIFAT